MQRKHRRASRTHSTATRLADAGRCRQQVVASRAPWRRGLHAGRLCLVRQIQAHQAQLHHHRIILRRLHRVRQTVQQHLLHAERVEHRTQLPHRRVPNAQQHRHRTDARHLVHRVPHHARQTTLLRLQREAALAQAAQVEHVVHEDLAGSDGALEGGELLGEFVVGVERPRVAHDPERAGHDMDGVAQLVHDVSEGGLVRFDGRLMHCTLSLQPPCAPTHGICPQLGQAQPLHVEEDQEADGHEHDVAAQEPQALPVYRHIQGQADDEPGHVGGAESPQRQLDAEQRHRGGHDDHDVERLHVEPRKRLEGKRAARHLLVQRLGQAAVVITGNQQRAATADGSDPEGHHRCSPGSVRWCLISVVDREGSDDDHGCHGDAGGNRIRPRCTRAEDDGQMEHRVRPVRVRRQAHDGTHDAHLGKRGPQVLEKLRVRAIWDGSRAPP
mmetsp:Transcript_16867/g.54008  ORF Transcript_16867/g.54008 Transcript_16867/m.54008 type:complete len:442 (+) Transcript_16867:1839-3164(+)